MKQLQALKDGFHEVMVPLINPSDYIDMAVLAASVKEDFTVPTDAKMVLFSATGDFYCDIGSAASASIPAADVTDGSAPEINPVARGVVAGETISLIAPTSCRVMMAFYR